MSESSVPVRAEPPTSSSAANELFETLYGRLKRLASRQLAAGGHATLDPTVLVHDLYLRIGAKSELAFAHPAQFFTYAAQAMRHLLCDRARVRMSQRAGGDWVRVTLTASDERLVLDSAAQALALDRGLRRLAEEDARAAQVVELIYFGGLTLEQVAQMLGLARRTIDRDWQFARAFLRTDLE
ncbi:ECF-type sigma factor [Dokdonella sp.]|uniref:ECF-type sigma factor n=1 Tax=Dokdonella sp. TaxID=2291710 RepID=UPI001B1FD630|nr:ECF-type sigma factor [Dokdonella sp.]MBO9664175.1 sigma-70 family RNA polymerase sigma factor [Dokdonella sp.]